MAFREIARRSTLALVLAGAGFLVGLGAVNVADYVRFHRAMARARSLSPAEWSAVGDLCRNLASPRRFKSDQSPPELRKLKPISGSLYPGCSDLLLYELGDVYLYLRVDTTPHNQRALLFTNSSGPQTRTYIWERDHAFRRAMFPTGRLVTVAISSMHDRREWVVLADTIRVYDRPGTVGADDTLVGSIPLASDDLAAVAALVRGLGPEIRGKEYSADGIIDGINLEIQFSPTGERGADDIWVSNTWVQELGPLLETISRLAPRDAPVEYKESMFRMVADEPPRPVSVRSLKEAKARFWGRPHVPWWCLWRRLVKQSAGL